MNGCMSKYVKFVVCMYTPMHSDVHVRNLISAGHNLLVLAQVRVYCKTSYLY